MPRSLLICGAFALALGACVPQKGATTSGVSNAETRYRDGQIAAVDRMSDSVVAALKTMNQQRVIAKATGTVRNALKDPGSAQFRRVRLQKYKNGYVVCGEVNGKNSYGGYVGFRPFVAGTSGYHIMATGSRYPSIDRASNAGLELACGGTVSGF